MSFLTVKNEIKIILDTLTGPLATDLFRVTYDYFEPTPNAYPSAQIGVLGGSSEIRMDTIDNWTTMQFIIRVQFQNDNSQTTHDQLLDTLDKFLIELRKDTHYTLNGNVQAFDVAPSMEVFYTDRQQEPTAGFDIVITARKLNTVI